MNKTVKADPKKIHTEKKNMLMHKKPTGYIGVLPVNQLLHNFGIKNKHSPHFPSFTSLESSTSLT